MITTNAPCAEEKWPVLGPAFHLAATYVGLVRFCDDAGLDWKQLLAAWVGWLLPMVSFFMEGEAFELIFEPPDSVGDRLDDLINEADETASSIAQTLQNEWAR